MPFRRDTQSPAKSAVGTLKSAAHQPLSQSRVGVVLLDALWRPVDFNAEAASILGYPGQLQAILSLDAVLPARDGQIGNPSGPALPGRFTSGRRAYVCQAFFLGNASNDDNRLRPMLVVILERASALPVDVVRWSEQYQLTTRERETVEHLAKGLSTKEIASRMSISPSTVKSFLKLVRVKMGASNRAGIVAKIHEGR